MRPSDLRWLRDNIYQHGRKFRPDELVTRAVGAPMTIKPYLAYLRAKYGELYRLPPADEANPGPADSDIAANRDPVQE
jgi:hypothetical protein